MNDDDQSAEFDFTALGLRAVREAREQERDFDAWRRSALRRVRQGLEGRPAGVAWEDESMADAALPGTVVLLKTAVLEARRRGVDPDEFLTMLFKREGPVPPAAEW
ncbi:unannotated protein [freshwater metagenome]|uniref:Unannotated protein n=1 Tax=freshwater metagenome TaxID=449393 RepID=A0A6J7JUK1_9ZZZZ|nr:hypothetical protein [Actinomycetota bacterium]